MERKGREGICKYNYNYLILRKLWTPMYLKMEVFVYWMAPALSECLFCGPQLQKVWEILPENLKLKVDLWELCGKSVFKC